MTTPGTRLADSLSPLIDQHDAVFLDLDGVVYLGEHAVPGAPETIGAVHAAGRPTAYLTNNAARTATVVAAHLAELGVPEVTADQVVTAAQAIARITAEAVSPGAKVLLVGGPGLREPLEAAGLVCVDSADDEPEAVVQGYHADVGWRHLAEASYAVAGGAKWFASNADLTFPTARGLAPGNGSLVGVVANATGQRPVFAGKPNPPLFDTATRRLGCTRPIMVGDRPDTDIDGAINAGVPVMGVLSGVCSAEDFGALPVGHRPQFVAPDIAGLLVPHPAVEVSGDRATCGDAVAVSDDGLRLTSGDPDSVEGVRALVGLAWHIADRDGVCVPFGATIDA